MISSACWRCSSVHCSGGSGGRRSLLMTAPRSPGTTIDPPRGSGLAWGGPARRPGTDRLTQGVSYDRLLDGTAQAIHDLVQVGLGDDERRRQQHMVAKAAVDRS